MNLTKEEFSKELYQLCGSSFIRDDVMELMKSCEVKFKQEPKKTKI